MTSRLTLEGRGRGAHKPVRIGQLQAQIDAAQRRQAEQTAAAAESATMPTSHHGQAILGSKVHQRGNLLRRLRRAKQAASHFVPTPLARLREVDVHAYAPMATSARASLSAPGRVPRHAAAHAPTRCRRGHKAWGRLPRPRPARLGAQRHPRRAADNATNIAPLDAQCL